MQIRRIWWTKCWYKVINNSFLFDAYSRSRGIAIPGIVEKCLSSTRAATRAKAVEALLLYVEVDTPDPVLVCIHVDIIDFLGRLDTWILGKTSQTRSCNDRRNEGNIPSIRYKNSQPKTSSKTITEIIRTQRQDCSC
jgi:hypothetical protein